MIKELTTSKPTAVAIEENQIILFNDDVNTFEWVIKSLVEICGHTEIQAEQCALIVHHKGKYPVKSGAKEHLLPCCSALLNRGLNAEVQ